VVIKAQIIGSDTCTAEGITVRGAAGCRTLLTG
jgi:hypothetical protein